MSVFLTQTRVTLSIISADRVHQVEFSRRVHWFFLTPNTRSTHKIDNVRGSETGPHTFSNILTSRTEAELGFGERARPNRNEHQ